MGCGGRVPPGEWDPQRLVREHLQVGGEAVHPLHVRHLDAVLDGDAGEGVEAADAVEDVAAAGGHGRRRLRHRHGSDAEEAMVAVVRLPCSSSWWRRRWW